MRVAPLLAAVSIALCGCSAAPPPPHVSVPGGDPRRGAVIVARAGCGACHQIPGVYGAHGLVGPPLAGVASRTTLAGVLPNTPDALIRWVKTPQAVVPGNAMPDMGLTDAQARDVAAYLETLS